MKIPAVLSFSNTEMD